MGWLSLKFLTFLCQMLEVALFIEKINEKFTLLIFTHSIFTLCKVVNKCYLQLAWSAVILTFCEVVRKLDNLTFCEVFT